MTNHTPVTVADAERAMFQNWYRTEAEAMPNVGAMMAWMARAAIAHAAPVGADVAADVTDEQIVAIFNQTQSRWSSFGGPLNAVLNFARDVLAAGAPADQYERYTEPTEIVAYLHQVVSGDGEPDQALSFASDNFPLRDAPGFRFRSISYRPLCFADVDHSSNPIAKSCASGAPAETVKARLTDDDIKIIWQTMPGGPAGWLKSFGFLQFARAIEDALVADTDAVIPASPTFTSGTIVRKKSGSEWEGAIVGTYSSSITPEGYAVESSTHRGSVQIYPVGALELVRP